MIRVKCYYLRPLGLFFSQSQEDMNLGITFDDKITITTIVSEKIITKVFMNLLI